MLIIGNNAGIEGWDKDAAKAFVQANTKVPTGVIYDFMADYALLGFTKIAQEQGEWAAGSALEVLDEKKAGEIPIVKNKKGNLYLNLSVAKGLGVTFNPKMLKNSKIIK